MLENVALTPGWASVAAIPVPVADVTPLIADDGTDVEEAAAAVVGVVATVVGAVATTATAVELVLVLVLDKSADVRRVELVEVEIADVETADVETVEVDKEVRLKRQSSAIGIKRPTFLSSTLDHHARS